MCVALGWAAFENTFAREIAHGEVAEWSIATVLKTVEQQCSVSSNLTLSALNFGFSISDYGIARHQKALGLVLVEGFFHAFFIKNQSNSIKND